MPNHIKPRLSCKMQVTLLCERPASVPRWSKWRLSGWAWMSMSQKSGRKIRNKDRKYGITSSSSNDEGAFLRIISTGFY